jgi:hypothetical protein
MKEDYATIVAGCLAAFDSLKRGETHERANKMMTRTAARIAAFKPDCPTHLLPASRVPYSLENPAPAEYCGHIERDWFGKGWSRKQG